MRNSLILSLIVIFSFVFTGCSKRDYSYTMNLKDVYKQGKIITPIDNENLTIILYNHDTLKYQFVDLRTPHLYTNGHLPNAVNLPLKSLYSNLKFFCAKDVTFLLYAEDLSHSLVACSYLNQLGITNVKAVGGGYEYIENHILKSFGVKNNLYNDEIPKYDFAVKFKELSKNTGSLQNNITPVITPNVNTNQIKKQEGGGGGCG